MIQGRCATLASVGAWERVRSHARRYRGSRYIPGPGVVGVVLRGTAPLHAVRVRQGDAPSLRSVTLPAGPLPAFRSAAWLVVHRTCHGPCSVLATLGHVPRQLLRGWRCRTLSMQQRASHPCANVRLRAMSQNLRSQVLRQAVGGGVKTVQNGRFENRVVFRGIHAGSMRSFMR